MKDKLTQDVDETTYLLSSEKNAARIKESIAQLEQGAHIDHDGWVDCHTSIPVSEVVNGVHIDEDGDLAVGSEKVGVASAKEKFTPGDWINNAEECRSSVCVDGAEFEIVSVYVSDETKEQDIANAHLIAAAPKMYRILQGMADATVLNYNYETAKPIYDLLAEARGENKDSD